MCTPGVTWALDLNGLDELKKIQTSMNITLGFISESKMSSDFNNIIEDEPKSKKHKDHQKKQKKTEIENEKILRKSLDLNTK